MDNHIPNKPARVYVCCPQEYEQSVQCPSTSKYNNGQFLESRVIILCTSRIPSSNMIAPHKINQQSEGSKRTKLSSVIGVYVFGTRAFHRGLSTHKSTNQRHEHFTHLHTTHFSQHDAQKDHHGQSSVFLLEPVCSSTKAATSLRGISSTKVSIDMASHGIY
jgi:hypothetical protein